MRKLLALLCLCAPLVAPAQDVVQRPAVKVGDFWRYERTDLFTRNKTGRPNFRVAFASKDVINTVQLVDKKEVDSTFTAEWNMVNDSAAGVYEPYAAIFKFPLKAGDSYRSRWDITRRRLGAHRVKVDATFKVIGWEQVRVPAGNFRALKLEGRGTYQRLDTFASGQNHWIIWYAPEVRRWVRWTYEDTDSRGQANTRFTDELIEVKLR